MLGVGDLPGQPREIARRHRSHARRGPGLGREPELPLIAPQLEGEVQAQRGRSGILGGAGRSGHRRLLSSSFWLNKVAGAYQQRPALLLPLHLHRISVEDGWRGV